MWLPSWEQAKHDAEEIRIKKAEALKCATLIETSLQMRMSA